MSTKGTRTKRTGFGKRPNSRRNRGANSFLEACQEVMNREAPPLSPCELPEESKAKGAAFPETDTANSCEGADPFEYKVLFERSEDPSPEADVPTLVFANNPNMFDRTMFLVLLAGMIVSIFGWISTYVVFRKALWTSTQEKIELQERLRQYEPEEQHP